MDEKKLKDILNLIQGITNLEWRKLQMWIDTVFNAEISKQANETRLTDSERVIEEYKHYSPYTLCVNENKTEGGEHNGNNQQTNPKTQKY